jgi:hypothetical protein
MKLGYVTGLLLTFGGCLIAEFTHYNWMVVCLIIMALATWVGVEIDTRKAG